MRLLVREWYPFIRNRTLRHLREHFKLAMSARDSNTSPP